MRYRFPDCRRTCATAREVGLISRLEPDPRQPLCTDLEASAREAVDLSGPSLPTRILESESMWFYWALGWRWKESLKSWILSVTEQHCCCVNTSGKEPFRWPHARAAKQLKRMACALRNPVTSRFRLRSGIVTTAVDLVLETYRDDTGWLLGKRTSSSSIRRSCRQDRAPTSWPHRSNAALSTRPTHGLATTAGRR